MSQRTEHAKQLVLADTAKERQACIARLQDYLARTGLSSADFARRINYAPVTLRFFITNTYHRASGDDSNIRRAVDGYIAAHPIAPLSEINGELYDTANVRLIHETFRALLPRPVAYMIYAPPGSQKTFALENEVARLNCEELKKNGHGRRAYYVYARVNWKPLDLMRGISITCGVPTSRYIDSMILGLAHEFQRRRVLLVIDEAQHLDITSLEIVRQLLDRPPHMSLLLAGSHDLYSRFDRFSATLEQWNSRLIKKVRLPGLEESEARGIIQREVGELLGSDAQKAERKIRQLIDRATVPDAFEKGRKYINVRSLTNALYQIRAAAGEKEQVSE